MPLLADFLHLYEAEFIQGLLRNWPYRLILILAISLMFYHWIILSSALSVNTSLKYIPVNKKLRRPQITKSSWYLYLFHEIHQKRKLVSRLLHMGWLQLSFCKLAIFMWQYSCFPCLQGFVSQLIRYSCVCSKYLDFLKRALLLPHKLLQQGYILSRQKSSL